MWCNETFLDKLYFNTHWSVPENIHNHPKRDCWGMGPVSKSQTFKRRVLSLIGISRGVGLFFKIKIPIVQEVWTFSGTTK